MRNKYPYTNFHELNADWILLKLKEIEETGQDNMKALEEALNGIPTTVTEKINELLESGQLAEEIEKINLGLSYLNALENKHILIMGDSISDTNYASRYISWVVPFMELCKNISGCKVTNSSVSGNITLNVYTRLQTLDISDVDIIIFFVGTNDYGKQTTIGGMNDTNSNTYNGALNSMYNYICNTNSDAQVFFISPLPRALLTNATTPLLAYIRSLYNHCVKFGWHFIDAYGKRPLLTLDNAVMKAKYFEDGSLHPSTAFGKIFAPYILSYLITRHGDSLGKYTEKLDMSSYIYTTNVTANNLGGNDNKLLFNSIGYSNLSLSVKNVNALTANVGVQATNVLPQFINQSNKNAYFWLGFSLGYRRVYAAFGSGQTINIIPEVALNANSDIRVQLELRTAYGCDYEN